MSHSILPTASLLAWLALGITSASVAQAEDVEFFEKQIRPILVEHCYECHAGDESSGGLLLDSRVNSIRGGDSGAAIVVGEPEQSRLIQAVRYENRDLQMPPQNRLDESQIAALEKWIKIGLPDPRSSTAASMAATGMSIDEGRHFWSFQPVASPDVPAVSDPKWIRTPIDAFILSSLEANSLKPAPPADRVALIRRLCLDLTGLPPTSKETDDFVTDKSPHAYERLVERLLASPQYGVRWGRHWLDVARYADSNGLDENLAFGNAWRYRDYVINAYNEDKPFDQFLVEQIAGDLLPDSDEQTKTATGFLVLGAKVLAEPDREKLLMDTIDEQLDTIGKAFFGLTLGCVRCHDHKFDPIKQRDYYALAAIFKSSKTFADSNTGAIKHWNEHVFADEDELEAVKQVDAEIAKLTSAASKFKSEAVTKLRERARGQATDYLVAATNVELDMPLHEIERIAQPLGLHPRILHHCRRHLHFHVDDPFFKKWYELTAEQDSTAIDTYYRPLLQKAAAAESAADDALVKLARAALNDTSGFLTVPAKPEFAFDAQTLAEYDRLMEAARVVESAAPDVHAAMGVVDDTIVTELPIHIRGSHLNLGENVARGLPVVMQTPGQETTFSAEQSGRLELARWMVDPKHPLTARVHANRIWRWHFGQGFVKSTENFGVLGQRPSHPALLDWLANYFIRSGWSTKSLHRVLLHSNAYRMSSQSIDSQSARIIDPENRLLWKFPLQRLEAEQLRDGILAVSNRLDASLGGKTVALRNRQFVFNHTSIDHTKYDSLRRAAYLPIIRNNLYTVFEQFDFPDPTMPTGDRDSTVVAPQALLVMNADWIMDSAATLADQLLIESSSDTSRVESAYRRVLGRPPCAAEIERVLRFIDPTSANDSGEERLKGWTLFCHSLFVTNEFMYVR